MPLVPVSKLHGTYNDFVVLDQRSCEVPDLIAFARRVCDRRAAIGADGLLAVLPSQIADVRMRVINADGSEAEMCGNGVRCVTRFLSERGLGDRFRLETLAGIIRTSVVSKEPDFLIRVNMGFPDIQKRRLPYLNSAFVSTGNPHVVIFMDAIDSVDLAELGRKVERDPSFPEGTNVHIAVRTGPQELTVRHWERGVGLTLACGTGAVACAAVAITAETVTSPVDVRVPGGTLVIEWDGVGDAYMSGPAVHVFDTAIASL